MTGLVEILGAATVAVIAGVAGAYKLGIANGRKNGNGSNGTGHLKLDLSQFMTRDLCAERHLALNNNLSEIKANVAHIPEIKARLDVMKEESK
jgi:hypothetical protein